MTMEAAFIEAFGIGIEWHLVKALNLNPEGVKQHSPGLAPWAVLLHPFGVELYDLEALKIMESSLN
jgi:hypothetical protein